MRNLGSISTLAYYLRKWLGWCPESPTIREATLPKTALSKVSITMGKKLMQMRKGIRIGLFLSFLLMVLWGLAFIPRTVIDTSFVLGAGEKKSISYQVDKSWTNIRLAGKTSTEGGYIPMSVELAPTQRQEFRTPPSPLTISGLFFDPRYNFSCFTGVPYQNVTFTFDNTRGNSTISVKFLLDEDLSYTYVYSMSSTIIYSSIFTLLFLEITATMAHYGGKDSS